MSKKTLTPNGTTLVEALLALFITLIISFCMVVFLRSCLVLVQFRPTHQDQMAILQLRQIASISSDIEITEDCLYMVYEHKEVVIEFENNRLVKKEGYEILMENIENAYFSEENEKIYLNYQKYEKNHHLQIY